jgi:predicted regulator of Ras-like GTPase activity (Roadblock/LC7/MglB family)
MFDFFKNLFAGKETDGISTMEQSPNAKSQTATASHASPPQFRPKYPNGAPAAQKSAVANGDAIQIPLQAVLNGLPLALKGRVLDIEVGAGATLSIAPDRVLSQLASGAVKIPFGELRKGAPQLFSENAESDEIQISLPLSELLSRISPALLSRRQNQKQIKVSEEISSPFGGHGEGLIFAVGTTKPAETPTPARSITPAAPTTRETPVAPAPAQPIQQPAPVAPVVPIKPAPIPAPVISRNSISSAPALKPPGSTPSGPPPTIALSSELQKSLGASISSAGPSPAPATPAPRLDIPKPAAAVSSVQAATNNSDTISVQLAAVAETWPEALRQEIVQSKLAQLQLALPVQFLEEAMKRGKVAFPWRTLRSWLKPAQPQSVSAHDGAILELPMKVVTPLFLARGKDAARPQQKVALDESIPNLFFGFPQPNAPAPQENPTDTKPALPASRAVSKPMDTNYYIWNDTADSAKVDVSEFKRQPSPETNFISRCATPNEVVSRAAAMDGVAGALVALPDGLMVASKLSPDLNGDTLAAFLPHIFGKVSQCTKELRMGELNNLNFTVGNVPWKIFRVNAIFFAAFGRAGQGLPTAELAALAGELDRKKQQ